MTGRQIRTTVPVLEKTLMPSAVNPDLVHMKDAKAKDSYRFFYNRRYSVRPLPDLLPGQNVRVKLDGENGWTTPAKVINKSKEPRSYLVEMANGTVTRRNRRRLQEVPETDIPEAQRLADSEVPQQDCRLQRWPCPLTNHQISQRRVLPQNPPSHHLLL